LYLHQDLVYSPEIIDRRLADSKRIENRIDQLSKRISKKCKMWKKLDELGTVDFVDSTGTLNLRVHPAERSRLILQMGTADPENALKAAAVVYQDVAGIDINCGCVSDFNR
jgi:tRNA-dihydrouridine synthase 2